MDISVVLDLMIHDIDLVLHIVNSPIKEIIADGINIISNSIDLANIKLIFENNCVANLTASRISNKDMRKIRVFENQCYSNIDLLNKKLTQHYADYNNVDNKLNFKHKDVKINEYDALKMELTHFCETIINQQDDLNNIIKAVEALQIAEQITEIINLKINS
jgi:predicted dehydrogenase